MELFVISFLAGVLTVAAPCILPLLPVIVGGSIARTGDTKDQQKNWYRPLIVALSLAVSVIIFTLLLKATTTFLGVPQTVWQVIAGIIVAGLGINFVWPELWEKIALKTGLHMGANKFLGKNVTKRGLGGDVITGFALGPVFNSCSPTYALIVVTVLPASFITGLSYLVAYAAGLAGMLLLVTYLGQSVAAKLGWLANPTGWFRRTVGLLFIIVGISVVVGLDKKVQTYVLERGWYDPVSRLEQSLD